MWSQTSCIFKLSWRIAWHTYHTHDLIKHWPSLGKSLTHMQWYLHFKLSSAFPHVDHPPVTGSHPSHDKTTCTQSFRGIICCTHASSFPKLVLKSCSNEHKLDICSMHKLGHHGKHQIWRGCTHAWLSATTERMCKQKYETPKPMMGADVRLSFNHQKNWAKIMKKPDLHYSESNIPHSHHLSGHADIYYFGGNFKFPQIWYYFKKDAYFKRWPWIFLNVDQNGYHSLINQTQYFNAI